ncbi:hypothetical protein FNV43_RR06634 [Rhamnella rubrinervis]|uniref:ALA-interacting subunit n=1 Tax=Rhamnella rubrinervis TaxID=2594499 RepID=A0A8K0MLM4_9ROSA|nr:hypothetical protein FNV43_RR06634 [Rhamnella rubrinervis]
MDVDEGSSLDTIGDQSVPQHSRRCKAFHQFTQQSLPACKPVLTPKWVISTFFVMGVIFIPVGLIILHTSRNVVEIVDRYDAECIPEAYKSNKMAYIKDNSIPKNCSQFLKVYKRMKAPIYIYYQLDNYYQNHRAWSLFNDTFTFIRGKSELKVSRKNIAWKSDRDHKFGKHVYPFNFQNGTLIGGGKLEPSIPLSDQEDLIVWMRTAALPSFRKLHGRIEEDLDTDDVVVVKLMNNYNTYSFGGKKKLVLSTSSWLGGKNDFLGAAYVFAGSSCIFVSLVFLLLHTKNPRCTQSCSMHQVKEDLLGVWVSCFSLRKGCKVGAVRRPYPLRILS